ncbi:MAG: hypothetical protein RLZZ329_42, partial [Pseudomonadota bacterium]
MPTTLNLLSLRGPVAAAVVFRRRPAVPRQRTESAASVRILSKSARKRASSAR